MRILSFDTSTDWLSVAAGDGASWRTHLERAGPANSERILPAIDTVLTDAGWRLADLDGIAFGAGPGAFTGVRIACSVAQGLALGAQLPVVPIPTLLALAQEAWRDHGAARVFACLDARMREVYLAFYARREGDGFAVYAELASLPGIAGVHANTLPTARAIGELACPLFESGQGVPASQARPLYIRQRIALTTAERNAGMRL